MSHSAKIFRRVILSCCINFGYRKGLDKRGEYQDFPSENFCLTVPKSFVGKLLNVALISGTEKTCIRGGGEYQDFPSKMFCVTVPKSFAGENFFALFQKVSGSEKYYGQERRSIKILSRKLFVSQCRNPSQMNPSVLCSRKIPVAKKFMDKRGSMKTFLRKLFLSQWRKISWGVLYYCSIFGYRKSLDNKGGGGGTKIFL